MNSLLRRLTRTGIRRAMGGETWAWLVVAAAAYLLRRARRQRGPETITLERGQVLYVGSGAELVVSEA